jgi:bis(5'-nucleosyl)-tetraphosphatase (symmetrical)
MATYVIGDVQGCHEELLRLLDKLHYDPTQDVLWFAGDLVNRGPKSLETLRFAKSLGEGLVSVLGNHDLHLLAAVQGNTRHYKASSGLEPILKAEDCDELCHWLQHRPLLHRDSQLGYSLIHAGLPPQWDIKTACACAQEVEAVLRGPDAKDYFRDMYGDEPKAWSPKLKGMERYRFITNCFTRLRYCDAKGRLLLKDKGRPNAKIKDQYPWFQAPGRKSQDERIIFGHWSTLGYRAENNVWAIDTGCLWGGQLTALQLDTPEPRPSFYQCPMALNPKKTS